MDSKIITTHFFLYPDNPNNPLPADWHLILHSNEQIQMIEPQWIKNREVTVNIEDEMSYVIVSAALGPEQPGTKFYRVVRFGSDITFYFNNVMAFLEIKSNDSNKSLALAIQFFNKLLRKTKNKETSGLSKTPLILFSE